MHKIFTLDDLYEFYNKQNQTCVFNSKESNYTIVVQVPETINFSDDYDPTYNLLPVHLMSCHLLENKNRSSISRKAMNEAIPSFKNRPILGYIQKIDDGDGNFHYDFAGHEMEFDEDGNIVYKEKVVGVIPESCNPKIVHNDEYDKDYLEVDGFIYEDYTYAAEILRNKGKCDASIEIAVDALSFDAKTKIMNIEQFHFLGITILGVTTDESHQKISPGMEGANITISDFSSENNSFIFNKKDFKEEIIAEIMSQLNDKKAFAEKTKEGGNQEMDKFNELLAKYNKTVEDISFDYENMTDEELVEAFANAFEIAEDSGDSSSKDITLENSSAEEDSVDEEVSKEVSEDTEETSEEDEETPETSESFDGDSGNSDPAGDLDEEESEEEHQDVSAIEDEDSTGTKVENSLNYSVVINGVKRDFELSLDDVNYSINCLVNDMYSETDNTYYMTVVYPESKHVIMIDAWNSSKAFKQSYKDRKGIYSLVGERIPVRSMWVTSDEEAELDKMRSNYSSIESELATFKEKELHTQRESVLDSEDYSVMADFADFATLKEHMDEYSVEDLTKEADLLYAKFMKANHSTFAAKPSKGIVFMNTGKEEAEKLPYGGLFKNFKSKK